MNRIGFGYDVHKLIPGRKLILGGEDIPSEKGLLGHSDADILLHAIADALLGAASLGDIGKHFPDSDQQFKGISSLVLLERVAKLISDHHYEIINVDTTVVLQRPKIAPYVDQMKSNIAAALHLDASKISIKATTNEGLGFIGAGEGAVAYAVALINSVS
ncbi:MAG TPA: 2-C-methyl-D-erythritol 2,4-cyclodiphosphate synthase [Bacteroidota bacterium]|nr:2-C-methyl-D-erythritol 2,4-cyclodiphosphate synthase [Bacteroidota bacterium]